MMRRLLFAAALATFAPTTAQAFCGFYVNGAGGDMFNNATQVVLMRTGTRTVLAMENNYQGPPSEFAMVVPVPVVLHEGDVKTLPKEVFAKVDQMSSPRLVEYWEQDPCYVEPERDRNVMYSSMPMEAPVADKPSDTGVKVEAKFAVGEYDVVVLSAKESTGLDRYLREQHYQIPAGAEPLLRPYVEANMKFFVAKVDPKKVKFVGNQAQLSPLRFHYDSDEFALPIRLGLVSSSGTQDLIVNILAPAQRYEVANYPNVTIPTNLDVKDEVRKRFGEFYAALFDATTKEHPGAVVTEYAWDASTCDPCPGPTLDEGDFQTLGADVTGSTGLVLTRLHARYGKEGVPNDLVFKAVPPIVGGREQRDEHGKLEERARPDSTNNFQGRYAIRHPWTGPVSCRHPKGGVWGGPPDGHYQDIAAATNIAFAPRGHVRLPELVAQDVPELHISGVPMPAGAGWRNKQGCGCASTEAPSTVLLGGLALMVLKRRRKRA